MPRHLLTAAALVLLAAGLPAASAAPTNEPAPRTVTVRGDCTPTGRVVLRQVIDGDRTTVTTTGRGVADGRWRGEHLAEVGVDATVDTRVTARAHDHAFRHTFEAEGAAIGGVLTLAGPRGAECHASYSEAGAMVVVTDTRLAGVVRRAGPRKVVGRGEAPCPAGTRGWSVSISWGDRNGGKGFGSPKHRCRGGRLLVVRGTVVDEPAVLPTFVDVQSDRGRGRGMRLRYVASDPAPADLPSRR
jgi:hypothetical protein